MCNSFRIALVGALLGCALPATTTIHPVPRESSSILVEKTINFRRNSIFDTAPIDWCSAISIMGVAPDQLLQLAQRYPGAVTAAPLHCPTQYHAGNVNVFVFDAFTSGPDTIRVRGWRARGEDVHTEEYLAERAQEGFSFTSATFFNFFIATPPIPPPPRRN